jgi:hypothetical protein
MTMSVLILVGVLVFYQTRGDSYTKQDIILIPNNRSLSYQTIGNYHTKQEVELLRRKVRAKQFFKKLTSEGSFLMRARR